MTENIHKFTLNKDRKMCVSVRVSFSDSDISFKIARKALKFVVK